MIALGGELNLEKVKDVCFSGNTTKPYHSMFKKFYTSLDIVDGNDNCIRINVENDWGYLVIEALIPLLKYADEVYKNIFDKLDNYEGVPKVIGLGRNEFRAADILHRLRGTGEPLSVYRGIPVSQIDADSGIELYGRNIYKELPF